MLEGVSSDLSGAFFVIGGRDAQLALRFISVYPSVEPFNRSNSLFRHLPMNYNLFPLLSHITFVYCCRALRGLSTISFIPLRCRSIFRHCHEVIKVEHNAGKAAQACGYSGPQRNVDSAVTLAITVP